MRLYPRRRRKTKRLCPTNRPVAAIFRTALFNPSEGFIRDQAAALTRWRPLLVGLERKGEEVAAILPASGLERMLFALRGRGGSIERRLRAAAPKLIHAHFATDGLRALPLARALGRAADHQPARL